MTHAEQLVALFAKFGYSEGDYVLSSGAKTNFYLDAKQITYHPDGVRLVGQSVLNVIRHFNVQAVGGLTMGADAIVASCVWAALEDGLRIPGFVVRKEPKKHGLEKWIEGVSPRDRRVAIVDDVITSGNSVLKAVRAAEAAGAEVAVVVGLIDRNQGGAAEIEKYGVPFRSICTIEEIRGAARQDAGALA